MRVVHSAEGSSSKHSLKAFTLRCLTAFLLAVSLLLIPSSTTSISRGTHGEDPCKAVGAYSITGTASHYFGTAGGIGEPTVALPLALGGCYVGHVHGYVTVCGDRCRTLPVVDYCQCYWGTKDQRIVDLSEPAWELVAGAPLSQGLVTVTVTFSGNRLEEDDRGGAGAPTTVLPNTAMR